MNDLTAIADARGIGSLDELLTTLSAAGYDIDPADIEDRYADLSTTELALLPIERAFAFGPSSDTVTLIEDDENEYGQGDQ